MTLWRVSNHASLEGDGGLRASGRWHSRGRAIVYCAPNPATALLEVLVHAEIDISDIPVTFRYLEIAAPDSVAVETARLDALGKDWQRSSDMTQPIGDQWIHSGSTALLRVPSVIVPVTWNFLFNPQHPMASQVRIVRIHEHAIDPRLLR